MVMLERGFLQLFRIRGVPVRAHWTVPLVCLLFSGFRIRPGLWLGVLAVILLHELGHAFIVQRVGLVNLGIDLTGFGGLCRWAGYPTPIQRAAIAWGGVLAQLLLLAVASAVLLLTGSPQSPFLAGLAEAFTRANLYLAILNLLPVPPLDGAAAWPWFGLAHERWKKRRAWKKKRGKKRRRRAEGAEPHGPLAKTLREALEEADRRRNLH